MRKRLSRARGNRSFPPRRNRRQISASGPMSNGGVGSKIISPPTNGAHQLQELIQHVNDHAQDARHVAGIDLIFEVDDGDGLEILPRQRLLRPDPAQQTRMVLDAG